MLSHRILSLSLSPVLSHRSSPSLVLLHHLSLSRQMFTRIRFVSKSALSSQFFMHVSHSTRLTHARQFCYVLVCFSYTCTCPHCIIRSHARLTLVRIVLFILMHASCTSPVMLVSLALVSFRYVASRPVSLQPLQLIHTYTG
jgi:hypothetical protein